MMKHLRVLFTDFVRFFRNDFHPVAYVYTLSIAAISILLVYTTDTGKAIGMNRFPTSDTIINNILMFVFLYFLAAVPGLTIRGQFRKVAKPEFFCKGLLLMVLIGFSDAFSWEEVLDMNAYTPAEQSYMFKLLWRTRNAVFVLPVLVLLRLFFDKRIEGLYGLCRGRHHIKAYMFLYVAILPLLIFISFTPDFLSYYPTYTPWSYTGVFDRPEWLNTAIFEAVYMSDFLMVELMFRGALVIGMASVAGRSAVLPMIVVYAALHFGKPVMETVSALFGGYFLGALAFQTRHIWGGVIIHMGIAFIIELLRFFQHYVLDLG